MRVRGWDERDYVLWSALMSLPFYGLVANDGENPMIARKDVVKLIERKAIERSERAAQRRKEGKK